MRITIDDIGNQLASIIINRLEDWLAEVEEFKYLRGAVQPAAEGGECKHRWTTGKFDFEINKFKEVCNICGEELV